MRKILRVTALVFAVFLIQAIALAAVQPIENIALAEDLEVYLNPDYVAETVEITDANSMRIVREAYSESNRTPAYPFSLTESKNIRIKFQYSYVMCDFAILDENDNIIFEDDSFFLMTDKWEHELKLDAGEYRIVMALPYSSADYHYDFRVMSTDGESPGYPNVVKTFDSKKITSSASLKGSYTVTESEDQTIEFPFSVTANKVHRITFDSSSYCYDLKIGIFDESGKKVKEWSDISIINSSKSFEQKLSKGNYTLKLFIPYDFFMDDFKLSFTVTQKKAADDYPNIVKTKKTKKITNSTSLKDSYDVSSDKGETVVYPFSLGEKKKLKLRFTDDTYAKLNVAIFDSSGKVVFEKKNREIMFDSKVNYIDLKKGDYKLKIYVHKGNSAYDYDFILESTTKTISKSMASCTKEKLSPGLGKGTWSTSDSSIVSISQKEGSTCTIRAKKSGTATVTFKNDKGKYTYKIKTYAYEDDPFRCGYFYHNSVGGVEPAFFIVNNSNKTIKYVNFNITVYNAVGDKVYNDIGGYGNAKLQVTGPLKPWRAKMYHWDAVFYDNAAYSVYVKEATVTYTDGTKKTYSIKRSFKENDKTMEERYYGVDF